MFTCTCSLLFVGDVSVEDKKLIYLPMCIMLMSRSPLYHVQKEILSWCVVNLLLK